MPGDDTDRAMTRLDRAACLLHSDETTDALEYATETVDSLSQAQRNAITLRGHEILNSLPKQRQERTRSSRRPTINRSASRPTHSSGRPPGSLAPCSSKSCTSSRPPAGQVSANRPVRSNWFSSAWSSGRAGSSAGRRLGRKFGGWSWVALSGPIRSSPLGPVAQVSGLGVSGCC
jgi:hypothetical protein